MGLVRVLEIPPSSGKFHFHGGEPQTFIEVDWFRDDDYPPEDRWQAELTTFLESKSYYRPDKAYLVLGDKRCFTIGYKAP